MKAARFLVCWMWRSSREWVGQAAGRSDRQTNFNWPSPGINRPLPPLLPSHVLARAVVTRLVATLLRIITSHPLVLSYVRLLKGSSNLSSLHCITLALCIPTIGTRALLTDFWNGFLRVYGAGLLLLVTSMHSNIAQLQISWLQTTPTPILLPNWPKSTQKRAGFSKSSYFSLRFM